MSNVTAAATGDRTSEPVGVVSTAICDYLRTEAFQKQTQLRTVRHPPRAGSLIEAMRAIGYSLETSLADVIDNSIAAGATVIDVKYADSRIRPESPYVAIIDNGHGMDERTLIEAMRHGSTDPQIERGASDLGRFGLGMKTASQAQCRLLTVVSKRCGSETLAAAQWDLDLIRDRNEWELEILEEADLRTESKGIPLELLRSLEALQSGTIVLWRRLDRLTEPLADSGEALAKRMDEAKRYLGLVFHRFIDGSARRVSVRLNGRPIPAHDPFLVRDAPPWNVGSDRIEVPIGHGIRAKVSYEAYVLPSLNRLSAKQLESLTSSGGLRRGQGFYVYRGDRLLVWGTWFKLVRQEELSKLARIKIDVPNSLDHLWALDIRKSAAVPPTPIRDALRKAVELVRDQATRASTHKGTVRTDASALWNHVQVDNVTFRFSINTEHQAVSTFRAQLEPRAAQTFVDLIGAIEDSVPYGAIYTAHAADQRPDAPAELSDGNIRLANELIAHFMNEGETRSSAIALVMQLDPFCRYPELMTKLDSEAKK